MRFGKFNLAVMTSVSLALLSALILPVSADTLVIGAPGDANNGNSFPFTVTMDGRYQQVYNSALFSGPISISALMFYNNNFQPGTAVIDTANYDIHLSATPTAVTGLDNSNYNNNVGANDSVFFNGTLGGAVGPTNVFTINGSPFVYDPGMGNLLVDITKTGTLGDGRGFLDARNGTFGTDSSRTGSFSSSTFDVSWGLVTGFTYSPAAVPEPGSVALLLGMGTMGAAFLRRRKQASKAA